MIYTKELIVFEFNAVNITLVVIIGVQLVSLIAWASSMNTKMNLLKETTEAQWGRFDKHDDRIRHLETHGH